MDRLPWIVQASPNVITSDHREQTEAMTKEFQRPPEARRNKKQFIL